MAGFERLLDREITFLKGVGPTRAKLLSEELNISTFNDLLMHFPFRYEDRSKFNSIQNSTSSGMLVQFKGQIVELEEVQTRKYQKRLNALFKDQSGFCELIWFKRIKWIREYLKTGTSYIIYGKLQIKGGQKSIIHPEIEVLTEENLKSKSLLLPVYPSTEVLNKSGLSSRSFAKLTRNLIKVLRPADIVDHIPIYVQKKLNLIGKFEAIVNIHFPPNQNDRLKAEHRIKFDELFFLQFRLLMNKQFRKHKIKGHIFEKVGETFNTFYQNNLKFELTSAQKRVIREIRRDFGSGQQMNRLLQGDVGSGKTIVALMTILIAIDNGFQACIMAPTEILATQHHQSIERMIDGLDIKAAFLSGSVKGAKREQILGDLAEGNIHILIGTHALIEDSVRYKNLGLAITDEQHRFGVKQRAKLWLKGKDQPPHILVMTATPIPRTLHMTLYGDLDVSIIDELPPGRKNIKTVHLFEKRRMRMIKFLKEEIGKGRQIYVVYPLIEESEKLDLQNLHDGYEELLQHFPRPDYQLSVVHGRMKPENKEHEMRQFKMGRTNILVGTTVIEVGVDVPNASTIVIENSERFGLSQLHQLRGRVGRGQEQSYCLLMSSYKLTKEAKERLETMVATNDGFKIAEKDMKLRGPGDVEGVRQSGLLDLKLTNLATDSRILQTARNICMKILEVDSQLQLPHHSPLRKYIEANKEKFTQIGRIS